MTFRVTNKEFNAELKDRTSAKFRSLSAELEQEVLTQNNHFMKCSPKIKNLEPLSNSYENSTTTVKDLESLVIDPYRQPSFWI